MKKIIIAILLAVSIFLPIIAKAENSELDSRYKAVPDNLVTSREYFYLGKVKMPLQMIYDLQWWSETKCYKKTLIVETYYSKGRITKTIKCTKLLNWWEPEKANCQAK